MPVMVIISKFHLISPIKVFDKIVVFKSFLTQVLVLYKSMRIIWYSIIQGKPPMKRLWMHRVVVVGINTVMWLIATLNPSLLLGFARLRMQVKFRNTPISLDNYIV